VRLLPLLLCCAGCLPSLSGEAGFPVGRAMVVPCVDESDNPGAMLIIESADECWLSTPPERPTCDQRRAQLEQNPPQCNGNLVIGTPSRTTLTGFFSAPLDPSNFLAASATTIYALPCNPAGPQATDYPGFEDALQVYEGDVQVIRDTGSRLRLDVDLYRPDGVEPVIVGRINARICRPDGGAGDVDDGAAAP
jgi:hypothetical protein